MPKGLYFTAVVFLLSSSFSFRLIISKVTEPISTKLGHISTYDYYLKTVGPNSPGIYRHRLGELLFGPTLNFDRTYLCNGT